MNRMEEYWALIETLGQTPPELEGSVSRAVCRAKSRRWRRPLGVLGSLAGICAAFILTVNASPAFAASCGNVPLLKEIAAAVAWSPSLRAAIEHDFVQYIGQSQTVDGIAVRLEYLIADQQQMVVFYTVPEGQQTYSIFCTLKDQDGNELTGYSATSGSSQDEFKRFTVHFTDLTPPDSLILELELVEWDSETGESLRRSPFSFAIRLDTSKTAPTITLPIGEWIELDGQRLLVDRLELAPTRTALYLDDDPDNTAWLCDLDFYFTDYAGARYDQLDSFVSAVGREASPGTYTYYHQSLYFVPIEKGLTFHITGALWRDKDSASIHVDLSNGSADWLPESIASITVRQENFTGLGAQKVLIITSACQRSPISLSYWDPEGGEHTFSGYSFIPGSRERGETASLFQNEYILNDYPWDSVELELAYTHITQLDSPLSVSVS